MATTTPRPAIEAPHAERYVIGRSGVFATLWDRQEKRLVVDNATEEHCRRVRDQLLMAIELDRIQQAHDVTDGRLAEQRHLLDADPDTAVPLPGIPHPKEGL
ncbi:hypothetical protein [Streptomyces sp. Ac-502]|uniref:hypothetical protein n=1 Tax=Streptomyces sp. Ac-502 TaxID=3342801 RepID=UPI0038625E39